LFGIVVTSLDPEAVGLALSICFQPAGGSGHGDPRQTAALRLGRDDDVIHIIAAPSSWINIEIAGNKGAGSCAQFMYLAGLSQSLREMKYRCVSDIRFVGRQEDAPKYPDNGLALALVQNICQAIDIIRRIDNVVVETHNQRRSAQIAQTEETAARMQVADILGSMHSDAVQGFKETRYPAVSIEIDENVVYLGIDHRQDLLEGLRATAQCGDSCYTPDAADCTLAPGGAPQFISIREGYRCGVHTFADGGAISRPGQF